MHRFRRAQLFQLFINKMAQPQHVIYNRTQTIDHMAFWLFVLVIKSYFKKRLHTTNEGFVFYKDIGGCRIGLNLIVLIYSCMLPSLREFSFPCSIDNLHQNCIRFLRVKKDGAIRDKWTHFRNLPLEIESIISKLNKAICGQKYRWQALCPIRDE